jgi:hypothetical protein
MGRTLWEVFLSVFRRNTVEGDEESEGFVPSPLDLSVRYSHGAPDDEIEREFHRINEQARELEELQHDE